VYSTRFPLCTPRALSYNVRTAENCSKVSIIINFYGWYCNSVIETFLACRLSHICYNSLRCSYCCSEYWRVRISLFPLCAILWATGVKINSCVIIFMLKQPLLWKHGRIHPKYDSLVFSEQNKINPSSTACESWLIKRTTVFFCPNSLYTNQLFIYRSL